jgi:hypothetical protein
MTPRRDVGFTEVVELGCTADEVFWHMVNPETASTIDPTIVEWRCDDFPPRVGSLNRLKAVGPLGIVMRLVSRFDEFDPPRRMVLRGVRPFFSRWTVGEHDVEPLSDGVRYVYRVDMRPPMLLRLPYKVMAKRMRRGVREGCDRLTERFGRPSP